MKPETVKLETLKKSKKIRLKYFTAMILCGLGSLSGLSGMGCTRSEKETATSGNPQSAPTKVVNLAIWPNYLSPETLSEFEKITGIKVQVSHYSSNEELLAKLQAGASGYDVALPSDYMVFVLAKLNLVEPLDQNQIPNSKLLDSQYLKKSYDPENKYSLPYDWGTTGIAVNRALYKGNIQGWKDLFTLPDMDGKISLMDDMREVIGAALKSLGYSLNTKNPEELKQAKELLLKTRKRVKAFTSETIAALTNNEVAVAQSFMTDALLARKAAGEKIEFLFPKEGGTFWIDNLSIPKGAQHIKEAHLLINYLLEPKVSAFTVTNIFVAPTNSKTLALVPEAVKNNPMLFPSAKTLQNHEMVEDLGERLPIWDRIWTEVKAESGS